MKRKRVLAISAAALLIAIIGYKFLGPDNDGSKNYIFDRSSNISRSDANLYLTSEPFDEKNMKQIFAADVVNSHTLQFFKFLQGKFSSEKTVDEHLRNVREYLLSVLGSEEGEKVYAIYEKFLKYETDFEEKKAAEWGQPKNVEEAIDYMKKMQDYRRDYFGDDVADKLFGPDLKIKEYRIRRSAIVSDRNLYAEDKLKQLDSLQQDMWGDEKASDEKIPDEAGERYSLYQEDQKLYSKDIEEMDEYAKKDTIRKLREKYFDSEQIKRMEAVDEKYDRIEKEYLEKEKAKGGN